MARRADFIDVSHHNGSISFGAVAEEGVIGVIAKATEGTSYTDPLFYEHRAGASAAGLAFGAYHFLLHGNVIAQIEHFLAIVNPQPGFRLVIDYEDASVGINDLIEAVEALEVLRPDCEVAVYGASKLTDDAHGHKKELGHTSLWAARYSDTPPKIAKDVWPYWSAWQWTDNGDVDGVQGAVDLNEFNSDDPNACLAWFGVAPVPQPEPEQPISPLVVIDIVVPDGISIEVSVNGLIMAREEVLPWPGYPDTDKPTGD